MKSNPTQYKIGIGLMVLLSLLAVISTAFISNLAAIGLIFGCLIGLVNTFCLRFTISKMRTKAGGIVLLFSYGLRMYIIGVIGYYGIKWLGFSFGMMLLLGLLPARFIYFSTKLDDVDTLSKEK